jgi:hypothetical protein
MAQRDQTPLDRERQELSEDRERNRIIEEVLREHARREVLRDVAYRRPAPSQRARIVALALSVVALALWLLPIPGLTPSIPFPLASDEEAAGVRLAAYVQAQQVEAYRRATGRLPDLLRETGEPVPGIDYRRVDARTYELTARTERATVRWRNSDSFPALLRDSAAARLRTVIR